MSHEENIPGWVYTEDRPASNEEYFENLTRCIFQGGLNWTMIANKWPNFRESFDNFDINKIASYRLEKQEELMNNKDIIRNKQKIMATIHNAEEFQRIAEKHGSFQKWLDSMNKSNNYEYVAKRLVSRFKRVGPATAHIFLWSVGEPIKYDETLHNRRPSKLA